MDQIPEAIRIEGSTLELGDRTIWRDLSLRVSAGEFLTVIGPNGAGKTSLLKVLLGLLPAGGLVEVLGKPPRRGNRWIGYVPQQKAIDPDLPVRGRDLVRMGLDGDRWRFGSAWISRSRGVAVASATDKPTRPQSRTSWSSANTRPFSVMA